MASSKRSMPRPASDQSTICLRGNRSARAPPTNTSTSFGTTDAIKTTPIAVAEPVITKTCQDKAVKKIPSPSVEISCPNQTKVKDLDFIALAKWNFCVREANIESFSFQGSGKNEKP